MDNTSIDEPTRSGPAEATMAIQPKPKQEKKKMCRYYIASKPCWAGAKCKFSHEAPPNVKQHSQRNSNKPSKNPKTAHRKNDPIDVFFAKYPNFDYRPTAPVSAEFRRMCRMFGWINKSKEAKSPKQNEAEVAFKKALVQQFHAFYGKDARNLESWRKLCHVLGVDPMPTTLKDCREKVLELHVNLIDLLDTRRTGNPVVIFPDLGALSEYTIDSGKFFPKNQAYGTLLKYLLREILP